MGLFPHYRFVEPKPHPPLQPRSGLPDFCATHVEFGISRIRLDGEGKRLTASAGHSARDVDARDTHGHLLPLQRRGGDRSHIQVRAGLWPRLRPADFTAQIGGSGCGFGQR